MLGYVGFKPPERRRLVLAPPSGKWPDGGSPPEDSYPRIEYDPEDDATSHDPAADGNGEWLPPIPVEDIDQTRVLTDFVRLLDGSDDEFPMRVLDYVGRYGTLGVCRHHVLSTHLPGGCVLLGDELDAAIRDPQLSLEEVSDLHRQAFLGQSKYPVRRWEPIIVWDRYVRHVRSLLRIAVALQRGELGEYIDWVQVDTVCLEILTTGGEDHGGGLPHIDLDDNPELAGGSLLWWTVRGIEGVIDPVVPEKYLEGDFNDAIDTLDKQRSAHASIVNIWWKLGQNNEEWSWPEGAGQMSSINTGTGLVGLLAEDIVLAMIGKKGIHECAGCGHPFVPAEGKRKPRTGFRAWCGDCGRAAQYRRQYERKRDRKARREREATND